jgi:hypothetical protein
MTNFYIVNLPKCICGKPIEVMIQSSGNTDYGKFCKKCAEKKLNSLNLYWEKQQTAGKQ